MRKLLSFLLVLLAGITIVMAQPQKMTYQSVVRNSNNELVVNHQVGVRVSILEDSVNGPMIYRETHTPTTNANGLVTIMIGDGIHPYTNTLSDVNWDRHTHYLSVEIDPAGGTNYTIFGAQQLVSVPYAFYSESARYVDTAAYAVNAFHADTAYYLANFQNSDTSLFAYNSDTAAFAHNANNAVSANYANSAGSANYSDSARIANASNTANYANTSGSAAYSDSARITNTAISANYATSAGSAATAASATYADSARVADYAHNSDTAVYANAAYSSIISNTANYADSARTANSAISANSANNALTSNYADSTRIANTSISANYADTADYNKLLNKPKGTNRGDILYWEPNDTSWHIVPAGNAGETLIMDTNSVPKWHADDVTTATVITDTVYNVSAYSASVTSHVANSGGSSFVLSGVCWDTAHNPQPNINSHTIDGIGIGLFTSNLHGLEQGTSYYVRAYATNSAGVSFGNELSFTTLDIPSVSTTPPSSITGVSAVCGGIVTDDGGTPVIVCGVCWDTIPLPTLSSNFTTDGSGLGSFTSMILTLSPGKTYYYRAYATNAIGTAFGNEDTIKTPSLPTVTTTTISNIAGTTATSGGNVLDDGGAPVTVRGICWNTTGSPTVSDSITLDGIGTGSFTSNMTNLTGTTVYYVRAYATNIVGTAYGEELAFSTNFDCGTSKIFDYDSNKYATVLIGTQCWMKENLKSTHYANGNNINLGSSSNASTAYRYYPENNSNNVSKYGYLYNWAAVMHGAASSSANPSGVQGVCPNGWHVPSDDEWTQLTDYLGSQSQFWCGNDNTYLAKSISAQDSWNSDSGTCTIGNDLTQNNTSGFNALPSSGYYSGSFSTPGDDGSFWTSTEKTSARSYRRCLRKYEATIIRYNTAKDSGYSVRCVKD